MKNLAGYEINARKRSGKYTKIRTKSFSIERPALLKGALTMNGILLLLIVACSLLHMSTMSELHAWLHARKTKHQSHRPYSDGTAAVEHAVVTALQQKSMQYLALSSGSGRVKTEWINISQHRRRSCLY